MAKQLTKEQKEKVRQKGRQNRLALKIETLTHYPPYSNPPACNICGYTGIHALSLGHILGNGGEHRRKLTKSSKEKNFWRTRGGAPFYAKLKKQGYPNDQVYPMQVECCNCQAEKNNNGGLQEYLSKQREIKEQCSNEPSIEKTSPSTTYLIQ